MDETGTNTKMPSVIAHRDHSARLRGRGPLGQRVVGKIPWGHWKTTTFVAGLRQDGISAPLVLDGAMNRDAFEAYLDQVLAPTLKPGDIVITDNLPAHKGEEVRRIIEARNASLGSCHPTRPTSNPIELAFAKLNTLLRTAAEPTLGALWDRIGAILDAFTPQECSNYLRHAALAPLLPRARSLWTSPAEWDVLGAATGRTRPLATSLSRQASAGGTMVARCWAQEGSLAGRSPRRGKAPW